MMDEKLLNNLGETWIGLRELFRDIQSDKVGIPNKMSKSKLLKKILLAIDTIDEITWECEGIVLTEGLGRMGTGTMPLDRSGI